LNRIIPTITLTILILIAGCSGVLKRKPLTLDQITIAEIKHRIEQNNLKYHSMKARAQISVESPRISFVAGSNIVLKKPDSLLIKIKAPFGISAGSVFIDRNQFIVYNSFENSVYSGYSKDIALKHFLPVDLKLENIIQAFSGKHPLDFYDKDSLAIDRNKYLIIGLKNNLKRKYWIDPQKFVVTEFQLLNEKDDTLIKLEYKQFEKKSRVFLPKLIQIFQPDQKTRVTIFYTSLEANCKLSEKDFIIKIPEQVERIKL